LRRARVHQAAVCRCGKKRNLRLASIGFDWLRLEAAFRGFSRFFRLSPLLPPRRPGCVRAKSGAGARAPRRRAFKVSGRCSEPSAFPLIPFSQLQNVKEQARTCRTYYTLSCFDAQASGGIQRSCRIRLLVTRKTAIILHRPQKVKTARKLLPLVARPLIFPMELRPGG
jgi:hypothetical protein